MRPLSRNRRYTDTASLFLKCSTTMYSFFGIRQTSLLCHCLYTSNRPSVQGTDASFGQFGISVEIHESEHFVPSRATANEFRNRCCPALWIFQSEQFVQPASNQSA